ncbi:Putative Polycomb protein suz12, partial [Caligus rogercresseyi]
YVGDIQMGTALSDFIQENTESLVSKSLYRNFLLHVSNLFDFGVISPSQALN